MSLDQFLIYCALYLFFILLVSFNNLVSSFFAFPILCINVHFFGITFFTVCASLVLALWLLSSFRYHIFFFIGRSIFQWSVFFFNVPMLFNSSGLSFYLSFWGTHLFYYYILVYCPRCLYTQVQTLVSFSLNLFCFSCHFSPICQHCQVKRNLLPLLVLFLTSF